MVCKCFVFLLFVSNCLPLGMTAIAEPCPGLSHFHSTSVACRLIAVGQVLSWDAIPGYNPSEQWLKSLWSLANAMTMVQTCLYCLPFHKSYDKYSRPVVAPQPRLNQSMAECIRRQAWWLRAVKIASFVFCSVFILRKFNKNRAVWLCFEANLPDKWRHLSLYIFTS